MSRSFRQALQQLRLQYSLAGRDFADFETRHHRHNILQGRRAHRAHRDPIAEHNGIAQIISCKLLKLFILSATSHPPANSVSIFEAARCPSAAIENPLSV